MPRCFRPALQSIRLATVAMYCVGCTVTTPPSSVPPPTPTPDSASALRALNVGIAYLEQHRFSQAEDSFRAALTARPDYLEGHINLAIALAAEVKYDDAMKELQIALAREPNHVSALYVQGLLYKYQGEKDLAGTAFEKVLAVAPTDVDTLYNLATVYKDRREFDRAIPLLEQVVDAAPHFLSAYYALGQAYLRQGDEAKGKEYIEKFQALSGGASVETAGLRYGEQGRFSMAVEDGSCRDAAGTSPGVRFVEASAVVGLDPDLEFQAAPASLVLFDIDGDTRDDLLLTGAATAPLIRYYRNQTGRLSEVSTELSAATSAGSLALAADLDNDGTTDLIIGSQIFEPVANGGWVDSTHASGIDPKVLGRALALGIIDLDHDGDLEILAARPEGGVQVWRNNGSGAFQLIEVPAFAGKGQVRAMMFSDLDLDRDVDAMFVIEGAPLRLLSNRRAFEFEEVSAIAGFTAPTDSRGTAVADLDGDGWPEIVLTNVNGEHVVYHNDLNRKFTPLIRIAATGTAQGVAVFDADLDGDLDLLIAEPAGLRYFTNQIGKLTESTAEVGLTGVGAGVSALAVGDLDGDADYDVVAIRPGAKVLVLATSGTGENSWIKIRTAGLSSNKGGIGTKIDVRAGCIGQKLETRAGNGFLSQSSGTLLVGLGREQLVDRVRLLWPLGVLQAEIDLAVKQTHRLEELDRKGSSCPFLWAWNGQEMSFVSDFQGGSPLGIWVTEGLNNLPDPEEWYLLPADAAIPRDGAYHLRVTESLEEVAYLDRALLRVVDLPETLAVFPNERLLMMPPFAPYGLHLVTRTIPLQSATDAAGSDVTQQLSAIDRGYTGAMTRERFRGFAAPWNLDLEFPRPRLKADEELVLLAHGWIEFTNSTPMFAASQAAVHPQLPALDILDDNGSVATTITNAGAPAGLPKWMVLPLEMPPGVGALKLRYRTNLEVHFDQIALGITSSSAEAVVTDVEADVANLRFGGYPTLWSPDGLRPMLYRFESARLTETWKTQEGAYTGYGDVRELLSHADDLSVVMLHGDEIDLRFSVAQLPPLPLGHRRHLIFHSVGYAKDLDRRSAAPESVGPLPFRSMERYPYEGPGPLIDPSFRERVRNWSTRYVRPSVATLR